MIDLQLRVVSFQSSLKSISFGFKIDILHLEDIS